MNDAGDTEQQLRIDLMTIQIERLRQEIKTENRKFTVQLLIAAAAILAAGIALGRFVFFHA
jgi:hypothetical protein